MSGIALQLYTMREPAKKDLEGMLKRVRDMGWEYVQWSGMPSLPAHRIRAALDDAGLKAVAAHVGIEAFEKDFPAEVMYWNIVGAKDMAPGGMMNDCRDSLEGWLRGAKRLDAVGAKLRGAGMRLSYHNHAMEFEKFDGDPRCKLDILMDEAKNVNAELDLAWVKVGGADPAAYIRKYAGRCPVIHVKELAERKRLGRPYFVPLGKGVLDWENIFKATHEAGVEWYVYEQDTCDDPFEDAKISYEFFKANGF